MATRYSPHSPQHRLRDAGSRSLTPTELLQVILDTPDLNLPERLLETFGEVAALASALPAELARVPGMTPRRVTQLVAAFELGRRAAIRPDRTAIHTPYDALNLFGDMALLDHEEMRVALLNTKCAVMGVHTVYQGSVHTTVIRVGELFRAAVRMQCAHIVVAHNHPSGDPTPSPEDVVVTREIVQAGKLLDIEVFDHLVIGAGGRFVSMKERALGFY